MLKDWGLKKLGKLEYDASIDEMKHADMLIQRILFLEGIPNVQKLDKINIGQNVEEIISSDLAVERAAIPRLAGCIKLAEEKEDYVSRDLFRSILESEEEHVDWLETQQTIIKNVGVQNYIQSNLDLSEF